MKTKVITINEYTKDKIAEDLKKLGSQIDKLESSIKNHNDELDMKKSKLEELKITLKTLTDLKKSVNY